MTPRIAHRAFFKLFLPAALTSMVLASSSLALSPPPLHTSGNLLCDSAGNTVVLKGVNLCSVEWLNGGDHVMQSVSEAIRHWHVTVIRFPITQDRWEGKMPDDKSGPDQSDGGAAYRKLVDDVVAAASREGVYVIVDLHWSDMAEWGQHVGQHKMPDGNTAIAWASIAARYANDPAVLFDPYNEPYGVSWGVWRNGGRVKEEGGAYDSPGMQGLCDVIRKTGANNVLVVGGLDYAFDLSGVAKGYAISGSNILYSCHVYPSKSPDWDGAIGGADKMAPVLIGEFGADDSSPEYARFIPRVLTWIAAHRYSAIAWCLHTEAKPCLISNWNYEPTYAEGSYVLSWLTGGPSSPERLECSGGGKSISLSWSAVPGAVSYTVYRSASPGGEGAAGPFATGVTGAAYADTGLSDGATYYYQVTAVNGAGKSGPSNERGATAGTPGGFEAPKPAFAFTATVPAESAAPNAPVRIGVTVTDIGKAAGSKILITLQVHDAKDSMIYQHVFSGQEFARGQARAYSFAWTPAAAGTYTIQAGAFGAGYSPRYSWERNAAILVVR